MDVIPRKALVENTWQARWFHLVMWGVIITLFLVFLRAVEPILLPFVLGLFVAYLFDPLACRLQRHRLNRTLATAIITTSLFALLIGLVMWLAPLLYAQLASLLTRAPALLHDIEINLRTEASPILKNLNRLTGGAAADAIPSDASEIVQRGLVAFNLFVQRVIASSAAMLNVMALLLITPIVCFYLLRDWPVMVRNIDRLLPVAYAPTIRTQIYLINRTLAGYLRGQITVMLILSVFYVIAFAIVGLNFGLILGILAGCIVIIPYIGTLVSVGLGLIVAHGQFDMTTAFWIVAGIYGVGQILESQVLTPKIIGDRVGLHPLWMLFGMLAGAVLLGFVGVLLAVPLTAVLGVLVKFAIARYLESGLYLEP